VRLQLEEVATEGATTPAPRHLDRPARASRIGGVALLIIIVATITWFVAHAPQRSVAPTFTQLTDQPGAELYPSLSPDGKSFVYQSRAAGKWDIYIQRVGGKNPVNLTENSREDNIQPAFSPEGERIAFRSERDGGGIFVMGATGENVKRVTDFGYNPGWSPDGSEIVCATGGFTTPEYVSYTGPLAIVNVSTGEKRMLNVGDALQPQWSPHGNRIAYWGRREANAQRDIWTVSSAGGAPVEVTNDPATDWNPVWAPDGRYLYFSSDRGGTRNLWRLPFEEESGRVLGSPMPVTTPSPFSWLMSFSRDGRRMIYVQQSGTSNIYKIDFDPRREATIGQPTPVTRGSRDARLPALSPDGQWVAFVSAGKQEDLFVVRTNGTSLRQLTDDIYKDRGPRWSPDGKQITFFSDRSGEIQIWSINADGSGMRQLTYDGSAVYGAIWSPDGIRLAIMRAFPHDVLVMETGKAWNQQTPS
jgi:Tol biopolymer transport system component